MGRGYLRQRAKGSWLICVEPPPDAVTGKRKQRFVTVHGTKTQAAKETTRLQREVDTGILVADPSTWTLTEYLQHWLTAYAAQNCRPKTQAGYANLIEGL